MASARGALLQEICGVPLIRLTCRAAIDSGVGEITVVLGGGGDALRKTLRDEVGRFVVQEEPLGTGNAVLAARELLSQAGGSVLVIPGNLPLVTGASLRRLAEHHLASTAAGTILIAGDPDRFGPERVMQSDSGLLVSREGVKAGAVGDADAACGCFLVADLLESLNELTGGDIAAPCSLSDAIARLVPSKRGVEAIFHANPGELARIADRSSLAEATATVRREKNRRLMAAGVTCIDPSRTYVELDVVVESDVVLYPGVVLEGSTRIGEGCVVRSSSRISNSTIGRNVEILESCVITDSEVGSETTVGPFARIREHSAVGERCRVGNFVELKKTSLGAETKAAHLAYLGDAVVGAAVNIGAGVITCNYDGIRKSVTVIEDGAFVGTDSQLIAPVTVGRGAYVAAGSCITQDVPAGSLAVARSRQTVKEGWAERRREARQQR